MSAYADEESRRNVEIDERRYPAPVAATQQDHGLGACRKVQSMPSIPLLNCEAVMTPRKPRCAVVVEDNTAMRVAITRMLAQRGFRVLTAEDGIDGLFAVAGEAGEVDLVIADVLMPAMNGDEFAGQVARRWPRIPIVFISGQEPDDALDAILAAGKATFLAKPFSTEAFDIAIEEASAVLGELATH